MKKSGTLIFLMELLIVILFFSLSVSVTVRIFATADSNSKKSARITEALSFSQNTIEQFKALNYDILVSDGWVLESDSSGYIVYTKIQNEITYEVSMCSTINYAGRTDEGTITAHSKHSNEPLCKLDISCYSANGGDNG